MPAAVDLLRSLRITQHDQSEVVMLAATDPANPYGALLRWPAAPEEGSSLTRSVGARVVLVDGALTAYLFLHFSLHVPRQTAPVEWGPAITTVSGFAILGWAWRHERHKVSFADFPHVGRWYDALMARPGVKSGMEAKLD